MEIFFIFLLYSFIGRGCGRGRSMTLLLGPPSSGKTTLLLALAGMLDPSLKVYNTKHNLCNHFFLTLCQEIKI